MSHGQRRRHWKPKSAAKRREQVRTAAEATTTRPLITDTTPCTVCAAHLWQHPRCNVCNRFVWCTSADASGLRHQVCPAPTLPEAA